MSALARAARLIRRIRHRPHLVPTRTLLLLLTHGALQSAFIWGRWRMFRIDGKVPAGVRLIEALGAVSVLLGGWLIASRPLSPWSRDAAAMLVAVLSGALFAWGAVHVRPMALTASFSADVPVRLISSGPFLRIRHPFYTAYVLAQLFVLVASASPWSAPLCVVMAGVYVTAARREERKFASSPLAEAYSRYARATGAFCPRFARPQGDDKA